MTAAGAATIVTRGMMCRAATRPATTGAIAAIGERDRDELRGRDKPTQGNRQDPLEVDDPRLDDPKRARRRDAKVGAGSGRIAAAIRTEDFEIDVSGGRERPRQATRTRTRTGARSRLATLARTRPGGSMLGAVGRRLMRRAGTATAPGRPRSRPRKRS
jgi:hypothetical protein